MSVSASSRKNNNGGQLRSSLRRYKSSATYGPGGPLPRGSRGVGDDDDGQEVLDLSRSRSDFDSEPEDGRMEDDDDDTINDEYRDDEMDDQDDEMLEDDRGSYPDEDEEDNPQDLSNNNINTSESGGKLTGPILPSIPGNGISYRLVKNNESNERNGKYE